MWSQLDAKWFGFFGALVGAVATLLAAFVVSGEDQSKAVRLEHELALRTGERDAAISDLGKMQKRLADVEENSRAKLAADNMSMSQAQLPNNQTNKNCVKKLTSLAEAEGFKISLTYEEGIDLVANGDLLTIWCIDSSDSAQIAASSLKGSSRDTINLAFGVFGDGL